MRRTVVWPPSATGVSPPLSGLWMRPVTVTGPDGTFGNGGAVRPLPGPGGIQPRSMRMEDPFDSVSGTRISKPTVELTERLRATTVRAGSYVPFTLTRTHS